MNFEFSPPGNIARLYFKTQVASLLASFAAVFFLGGCAAAPNSEWLSTLDANHALVGKIWASQSQQWISERELNAALAAKKFILLGETHDNPDHHRLQLKLLKAISDGGSRPAIAMEQFDIEQQAAIDSASKLDEVSADVIADAGKLNRKGWNWDQYRGLVEFAIAQKLPLRAANLSRADARRVFTEGFKASPVKFDDVFFAATWNSARTDALKQELVLGHCGQLPDSMAPGMATVQRARDAMMANSVLVAESSSVVLIAGRGHVRRDRAVPLYLQQGLRQAVSTTEIAVVAFMEVEGTKTSPQDYVEIITGESKPYDYIWFTPRTARKDPCDGMSLAGLQTKPAPQANVSKPK